MRELFRPEPLTDFSKEENKKAFEEALKTVESELGKTYPLVIGGKAIDPGRTITSTNPAKHSEVIGYVGKARLEDVDHAIAAA
ncbi:MAG: L-glutamate gamma-semialdehyde dehydrogenase, partial [Candidatus Carbobacillus sp.]|nr:L-glutamate gamma-semialdehyde dehydrogenase [Candidatus Carbobacillus sp.]